MIYKSSECNYDMIVSNMKQSETKMLLFLDDNNNSLLHDLEETGKYDEIKIIENDKTKESLRVYLVPIRYINDDGHRVYCRDFAIETLYVRWCKLNDRQRKSPYTSKLFMKYLDEIGFFNSDYAVFEI